MTPPRRSVHSHIHIFSTANISKKTLCNSQKDLQWDGTNCYYKKDQIKLIPFNLESLKAPTTNKTKYGKISKTESGKTCQKWSVDTPHKRNDATKKAYNNKTHGIGDHNYCRDPNNDGVTWCYSTDPNKGREEC